MLIALNKERQRVSATSAERALQYFCPACGNPVILKRGHKVVSHFAHKHLTEQKCFNNETIKHYKSKLTLAQMLMQQGYQVEIEPFLKEIRQIPDLIINNKYAFELQLSPIPYRQVLQRTEGLNKLGYKVVWLLDDIQIFQSKVKLSHFQSIFINPITRRFYTFNLEKQQIFEFKQLQSLGGNNFLATKMEAHIKELFIEIPHNVKSIIKLSKSSIIQYIKYCRWQNSVLQPTLSAMYQLRLTDEAVVINYGYIFPEQIYIENHPIEWQLHVDLMLNSKDNLTIYDFLDYFKIRNFLIPLESKLVIVKKLINNYLNLNSKRGNDVQILL
ncbi:TPA: competence protein CoiA family protein [Staphylococcus argenteus]|uniref:Competence protein CoiA-like family protein n=1 Tax=Staphylococcus argenteus TaxID=985002 RepID=A0A7U7PY59_9STAP|nr:competence protein CoiA family protein [Staphylococcus argenteus]BBN30113.1 competence protein CoiA [Staphylococcus aureus]ATY56591.1 competence protein CoiA [Staphylococcus argenteus]ATZ86815.1 competence protein CoiA [Staphylococcus argenteus]EKF1503327.1 competence protein CoiA [Staphylococcus argenteus]EYG93459.1 competence protein [Staphylococcus argenteus]